MKTIIAYAKNTCTGFIGRFKPGIWIITLVGFLNSAGFSISLPFIALYLHKDRGLSMTAVGFIILIGGLISALLQIYAGALCDRLGRRPLLVVSVAASAGLHHGAHGHDDATALHSSHGSGPLSAPATG
jgi:MFS family permease